MPRLDQEVIGGPASAAAGEQRRHKRHVCLAGGVLCLAVRPTLGGTRALLADVSAGGIGLLSGKPLAVGSVLALQLGVEGQAVARSVTARVVHARPHPAPADAPWRPRRSAVARFLSALFGRPGGGREAESAWFIGCQFNRPLTEEELQDLLRRLDPHAPDA